MKKKLTVLLVSFGIGITCFATENKKDVSEVEEKLRVSQLAIETKYGKIGESRFKLLSGLDWILFTRNMRKGIELASENHYQEALERFEAANKIFDQVMEESKVVPLKSGGMKMGLVEIKEKSLSFPAQVTVIKDMPIEVMVSTDRGRLHETLFTTKARPFHLQTMLIALGAENGARIATEQSNQGDFLKIEVEWQDAKAGKTMRKPIEYFVMDDKQKPVEVSDKRWVFVGSEIDDSAFLADWTGDMLVNYSVGSGVIDCAEEKISSAKQALHSNFAPEMVDGTEVKIIISLLGKGEKKKALGK